MQPRLISGRRKDGLFWLVESMRGCKMIVMKWATIKYVRCVVSE